MSNKRARVEDIPLLPPAVLTPCYWAAFLVFQEWLIDFTSHDPGLTGRAAIGRQTREQISQDLKILDAVVHNAQGPRSPFFNPQSKLWRRRNYRYWTFTDCTAYGTYCFKFNDERVRRLYHKEGFRVEAVSDRTFALQYYFE